MRHDTALAAQPRTQPKAYVPGPDFAGLSAQELADLTRAVGLLESASLPVRLANLVGSPVEKLVGQLPGPATAVVKTAVDAALAYSMKAALLSLGPPPASIRRRPWLAAALRRDWVAKASTVIAGGMGGAGGFAGTIVELPVTTALILRGIAQIGLDEGEDIASDEFKATCLSVLAMGGRSPSDDAGESGYYAVRVAIADALVQAAGMSLADLLPKLAVKIANKFGSAALMKVSAQAVPIAGALAGATINFVFMDHFQDKARGHFIVRRLERAHGGRIVKAGYDVIARSLT